MAAAWCMAAAAGGWPPRRLAAAAAGRLWLLRAESKSSGAEKPFFAIS
jgi:hypothetical protein